MQLAPNADAQRQFAAKSDFPAVRHLVPSKCTRNRCKQEVPMALEKTGLMRRRGEHAFAA
jgi:hypothetical protein